MTDESKQFIGGLIIGSCITAAIMAFSIQIAETSKLSDLCKAKGGEYISQRCLRVEEIK